MNSVLLTRHGQTDWNLSKQYQGWGVVPLNEVGQSQARSLGTYLAANHDVTNIYASDLLRVKQTVAALADMGVAPSHRTSVPSLRERDKGLLQGLTDEDVLNIDERFRPAGLDGDDITSAPPDGESYQEMYERVVGWWQRTIETHDLVGGDILIVAHGGSLRCLLAYFDNTPLENALDKYYTHNCSVTELEVADGETQVVAMDETSFL